MCNRVGFSYSWLCKLLILIVISCVNTNLHVAQILKDSVSFMSIKLSVQLTIVGKVTLFFV